MAIVFVLVMNNCANTGTPSGGIKDVIPPVIVESTPEINQLGYSESHISIEFDEFVVLKSLNDHFLVSPPTLQKPEVKTYGKELVIDFEDTLQSNTTYTLYFGDAIVDNNEGNPIKDFAFSFSTGYEIDTMRLQGHVLDAEHLTPVKGIIVGIYSNHEDSAFTNDVPLRIAKTDEMGYFSVNNVKPGAYIVRALSEMDNDFRFNQPGETIAFLNDTLFETSLEHITLLDSIFMDSIGEDEEHIHVFQELRERDTVVYYPDDIVLLSFTEYHPLQAIRGKKREQDNRLDYDFASKIITEPKIRLLDEPSTDDWYVAEYSADSLMISYWVKDTALINSDTIAVILDYQVTDSLEQYVWNTDTLQMRFKHKTKSARQQRKDDKKDEVVKPKALSLTFSARGNVNYFDDITITSPEPLASINTEAIHLFETVNDSTNIPLTFEFKKEEELARTYRIRYEWDQEKSYFLSIDSATFYTIYGATNDSIGMAYSIVGEDKFSTIFLNISNLKSNAVVQLMNASQEVLQSQKIQSDEELGFYYLKPNKYYFSLFYDTNNNGKWDPGSYEENLQAEEVHFFSKVVETKAYYEIEENWDLEAVPLLEQRPKGLQEKKEK